MAGEILFVSDRADDLAFGRRIADQIGVEFLSAVTAQDVERLRNQYPEMVILWDVDHAKADLLGDPSSVKIVGKAIMEAFPPDRVFAVSDRPLRESPYLFGIPAFGHHLFRQYGEPAAPLCSRLLRACSLDDPFGVSHYVPADTKLQKIKIFRSTHKKLVIDAVQKVFERKNMPSRILNLAVQGLDELIMNAVFDAPMDSDGKRYRRMTSRDADFELKSHETVDIAIAETDAYVAVSVTDQFGSLDKDTVLGFIRRDYKKEDYEVRDDSPSAGLGIYGLLGSGLSLLFVSQYRKRTEVIAFFPLADNFRAFRESFRFFSFILR